MDLANIHTNANLHQTLRDLAFTPSPRNNQQVQETLTFLSKYNSVHPHMKLQSSNLIKKLEDKESEFTWSESDHIQFRRLLKQTAQYITIWFIFRDRKPAVAA